jgi:hypothetical protein
VGDVKQSIYRWRNGDWGILNSLGSDQSKVPLCDAKVPLYDAEVPLYDAKPLHCESGVQLPFPFPVRVETLKTNRRSETNVIHFNNRLFTAAVDYLNALHLEELKEECIPLKRAYADVAQESPKTENKGYVKVSFLEPDEEQNYTEKTLSAMGEEVQRLLSEGVKLNDITILVRKNKNIPPIADYFDKELHLPVVSDEAFRLDASLAICMLIDALRYLSNPEEKVFESIETPKVAESDDFGEINEDDLFGDGNDFTFEEKSEPDISDTLDDEEFSLEAPNKEEEFNLDDELTANDDFGDLDSAVGEKDIIDEINLDDIENEVLEKEDEGLDLNNDNFDFGDDAVVTEEEANLPEKTEDFDFDGLLDGVDDGKSVESDDFDFGDIELDEVGKKDEDDVGEFDFANPLLNDEPCNAPLPKDHQFSK